MHSQCGIGGTFEESGVLFQVGLLQLKGIMAARGTRSRWRGGDRRGRLHGVRQNENNITHGGREDSPRHSQAYVGRGYTRGARIRGIQPVRTSTTARSFPGNARRHSGLDVKSLQEVLNEDSTGLVLHFASPDAPLYRLLDDDQLDLRHVKVILRILAKACTGDYGHSIQVTLRRFVKNQTFLTNILPTYFTVREQVDSREDLEQAERDLLTIFQHCYRRLPPRDVQQLRKLVECVATLTVHRGNHMFSSLLAIFQEMEKFASSADKQSDLRQEPLVPPLQDPMWHSQQVLRYLKPLKVRGKYDSVKEYLKTQFFLLREDLLGPLRQAVKGEHQRDMATIEKIAGEHRYCAILIDSPYDIWGPRHWLKITHWSGNIDWTTSDRLRPGSLVYLRHQQISMLAFARITQTKVPDKSDERHCSIQIQLEGDNDLELPPGTYIVVETDSFYEAYCHVMTVLQGLTEENLPLKDCIVDVNRDVGPPQYLTDSTLYCLAPLRRPMPAENQSVSEFSSQDTPKGCSLCSQVDDHLFPVLSPEAWPSADVLELDASQLEALRLGLTKKVALIQGPPGTGKTHVGLKIIRALLHNMPNWVTEPPTKTPILIVCFTNHALDQFLEGVLSFTEKVLRVGGRCGSKILQPYTLKKMRQAVRSKGGQLNYLMGRFQELMSSEDEEEEAQDDDQSVGGNIGQKVLTEEEEDDRILAAALEKAILLLGSDIKLTTQFSVVYKEMRKEADALTLLKGKLENFTQNFLHLNDIKDFMREDHYLALSGAPEDLDRLEEWLHLTRQHIKDYDVNPELKHLMRKGLASAAQATRAAGVQYNKQLPKPPRDETDELDVIVRKLRSVMVDKEDVELIQDLAATGQTDVLRDMHAAIVANSPADAPYTRDDHRRDTEVQVQAVPYGVHNYEKHLKAVRNRMCHVCSAMPEDEIALTGDLWTMEIVDRWRLYNGWRSAALNHWQEMFRWNKKDYLNDVTAIQELNCESDYYFARTADVVGMTTTGAAKNRKLILRMRPRVVFVEEAAEVLEAHIIAALVPSVQHLILIGDHKQLRPTPTVYELVRKHRLDVSLFERLVNNRMPSQQLTIQHRMRPCVVNLLVPSIYPVLESHSSVHAYESIRGMGKDVFFFSHSLEEASLGVSKINTQEAAFLVGLCKHLLRQGYGPEQMTILAAYSKQVELIRKLLETEVETNRRPRVTSIDNYQGEENDIILLSFVRSNRQGKIGFLSTQNRVCVALSRVRKGLYAVGNFQAFAKQGEELYEFWYVVHARLEYDGMVGSSASIFCHRHPEKSLQVSVELPFQCWDSLCHEACGFVLKCGHACGRPCHDDDLEHVRLQCQQPCDRKCPYGHPCLELCGVPCSCKQLVSKTLPNCGHVAQVECGTPLHTYRCVIQMEKIFSCGHSTPTSCHSWDKVQKCMTMVTRLLPCSHTAEVPCHKAGKVKCEVPVDVTMRCGHVTPLPCHTAGDVTEEFCTAPVHVVLPCNHEAVIACNRRESTPVKCTGNTKVKLPCGHHGEIPCGSKIRPSTLKCSAEVSMLADCGHEVRVPCQDAKSNVQRSCRLWLSRLCVERCRAELGCGHPCPGRCGSCGIVQVHELCAQKCGKELSCGHPCGSPCGVPCPPCKEDCERGCEHMTCNRTCGEPCVLCTKPCKWHCKHGKCSKQCHEICSREPCESPCPRLLNCNHPCYGFCGEPCPPLCVYCNPDLLPGCFLDATPIQDPRLVLLEDCGHVVESRALQMWFGLFLDEISRGNEQAVCPICSAPIRKNRRYGQVLRQNLYSINAKKSEGRDRRHKLLRRLDLLKEDLRSEHEKELHQAIQNVAQKRHLGCLAEMLMFFTDVLERVHDVCAYIFLRHSRDTEEVCQYLDLLLPVIKKLVQQGATLGHLEDLTWQVSRLEHLSSLLIKDLRRESEEVQRCLAEARDACLHLHFGEKEDSMARKAIIKLNKTLGYSAVPLRSKLNIPRIAPS